MISLPSYLPIFEKDHLFKRIGIDATARQQQTHTLQLQDKRGWGLLMTKLAASVSIITRGPPMEMTGAVAE